MDALDDITARVALLNKSAKRRRALINLAESVRAGLTLEQLQEGIAILAELQAQGESDLNSLLVLEIERLGRSSPH